MPQDLPHDISVERSMLGAMILNKSALAEGINGLVPEDFHYDTHRVIFKALQNLSREREDLDIITLASYLEDNGKLQGVGGRDYLNALTSEGVLTYHAKEYVDILREKSLRRKLIHVGKELAKEALDNPEGQKLLEQTEKKLFEISQLGESQQLMPLRSMLPELYAQIEEFSKDPDKLLGIPTGFIEIDTKTNGLQKSDLILIAARPSMGKSSLGMNIAQHAAFHEGKNVCFFSLEMSRMQLLLRIIASEYMIPLKNLLTFHLTREDQLRFTHGIEQLDKAKLFIDDTAGITLMELRSKLRRHRLEEGPIDLIVVDYLQLMDGGGGENRQVEIAQISRGLKAIAREMNCPLIAISQLSRSPEMRKDKRPMLSDLRESGAIEQDADLVMFIYRDDYYDKDSLEKNVSEIHIAKQRNGETGMVKLTWMGPYTKFGSKAYSRDDTAANR